MELQRGEGGGAEIGGRHAVPELLTPSVESWQTFGKEYSFVLNLSSLSFFHSVSAVNL